MQRPRTFADETPLARTRRSRRIVRALADLYPDAHCELVYANAFELLVATMLSAQTTDTRVNLVTPVLFARYPDAAALAAAQQQDVEELIASTGFFRAKSRALLGMAQALCDYFGGEVPRRLDDLVTLPGVGRKTANVVLGNAFGVPGITVDTHVGRLARRLGLTAHLDPMDVEADLAAQWPRVLWTDASQLLIWHGRRRCMARRPACGACPLSRMCPSFGIGPTDPAEAAALVRSQAPS